MALAIEMCECFVALRARANFAAKVLEKFCCYEFVSKLDRAFRDERSGFFIKLVISVGSGWQSILLELIAQGSY